MMRKFSHINENWSVGRDDLEEVNIIFETFLEDNKDILSGRFIHNYDDEDLDGFQSYLSFEDGSYFGDPSKDLTKIQLQQQFGGEDVYLATGISVEFGKYIGDGLKLDLDKIDILERQVRSLKSVVARSSRYANVRVSMNEKLGYLSFGITAVIKNTAVPTKYKKW